RRVFARREGELHRSRRRQRRVQTGDQIPRPARRQGRVRQRRRVGGALQFPRLVGQIAAQEFAGVLWLGRRQADTLVGRGRRLDRARLVERGGAFGRERRIDGDGFFARRRLRRLVVGRRRHHRLSARQIRLRLRDRGG